MKQAQDTSLILSETMNGLIPYNNFIQEFHSGNIHLYQMDCMELLKQTPDNYYSLCIVDPPYGIGMGGSLNVNSKVKFIYKKWDTKIPSDKYFNELKRVSVNQIIWGGNYFPTLWNNGCKGFIHWDKMNHHDNRADGEMAWTSFDIPARNFRYMWDGNRYGFEGKINGVGLPTIRIHPTEKPVALYKWLLKNYAKQGDKILDTHAGSRSLAIACHQMGFDHVSCEIDKDYHDDSVKRYNEAIKQQTLFNYNT